MWQPNKRNRVHLSTVLALVISAYASCAIAELHEASVAVGNAERHYLIYTQQAPSSSKSRPILILLHGHGGSASQLMGLDGRAAPFRHWLAIADQNDAVLMVPDGTVGSDGKRGWNDLRGVATNPSSDDLAFVRTLLERAVTQHSGDPHRVFLVGISNGGHMALRVALEASELVSGVGVIAAAMPADYQASAAQNPVSVVFMNGTRDRLMPYRGGEMVRGRGVVLSTEDSFAYWADVNQCEGTKHTKRYDNLSRGDRSRVIRSQFNRCAEGTRVALFEVRGAGHSTPSISDQHKPAYLLLTGRQNWDIESALEIWQVFSATPQH